MPGDQCEVVFNSLAKNGDDALAWPRGSPIILQPYKPKNSAITNLVAYLEETKIERVR